MKRREATIAFGLLAVVPFAGEAQPTGESHRIGFLGLSSASDYAPLLNAFLFGLSANWGTRKGGTSSSSTAGGGWPRGAPSRARG